LRRLRTGQGLSQDAFAYATGFHRNYIGQLERGEKSPSLNALFIFGKACGVAPSQLLKLVEKLYSPD
jgi:transcriptional regulator with XRE-family HTH domain